MQSKRKADQPEEPAAKRPKNNTGLSKLADFTFSELHQMIRDAKDKMMMENLLETEKLKGVGISAFRNYFRYHPLNDLRELNYRYLQNLDLDAAKRLFKDGYEKKYLVTLPLKAKNKQQTKRKKTQRDTFITNVTKPNGNNSDSFYDYLDKQTSAVLFPHTPKNLKEFLNDSISESPSVYHEESLTNKLLFTPQIGNISPLDKEQTPIEAEILISEEDILNSGDWEQIFHLRNVKK